MLGDPRQYPTPTVTMRHLQMVHPRTRLHHLQVPHGYMGCDIASSNCMPLSWFFESTYVLSHAMKSSRSAAAATIRDHSLQSCLFWRVVCSLGGQLCSQKRCRRQTQDMPFPKAYMLGRQTSDGEACCAQFHNVYAICSCPWTGSLTWLCCDSAGVFDAMFQHRHSLQGCLSDSCLTTLKGGAAHQPCPPSPGPS